MISVRVRSALVALLVGGSVFVLASGVGLVQPVPSPEELTHRLVALSAQHRSGDPAAQARLAGVLGRVAAERHQLLASLVERDPGAVLRVVIPAGLRSGLPPAIQAFLEQEVEEEGTLEVLHEDRDTGSRYLHFLHTAAERLSLHFAADPPELETGDHVRVRGVRVGAALALAGSSSVQLLTTVAPNTFGEQRTIVILVNFQNNPVQPYTPAYAQSVVFSTTSGFYLENSYQQTSLTGDVYGWFTIAQDSTVCAYSTTASLADQAATAAGANLTDYSRRIYAFPSNACSWWGLGTVGGNPSKAWINGSLQLRVVGHELGHNFGDYHSHSLSCTLSGCVASEYGDGWDIMGATVGHLNAFQKARLGWLGYGVSPPMTTVQGDGVYSLDPYESVGANPKALAVLKATDPTTGKRTWYFLEYRLKLGFDSNLSPGVVLHTGSESSANSSNLWDTDPVTSTFDPVLNLGQTYNDPTAGVTLTTLSTDAAGATVQVTLGPTPCVEANPTVALSPTATQWISPGTTASYTVSVTNNDNAACAASDFALQAVVLDGWTAPFGASALTLSPGASGSTTLQITPPVGTPSAFYTIPVSATNSAHPMFTASASATVNVVACVATNPTVALSPTATQWVSPGTTASYTVSLTNNDTGCTASDFALDAVAPAGWTALFGASTLTLSPGASGSTSLQITPPGDALSGLYTIPVTATNSAQPTFTASASATVSVAPASLDVTVTTDQPSYSSPDWVTITADVRASGAPVANANVTFTITKADGSVVTRAVTTGTDGLASFKLRLKHQDPVGLYTVTAAADLNNVVFGSGMTSFTVQ